MQVGVAAAIVVQMGMSQPTSVGGEDRFGGVVRHLQISVTDVEVQTDVGQRVEQLAKLRGGVVVEREAFDHQSDAIYLRGAKQSIQRRGIAIEVEAPDVPRGVP